MDYVSIFYNILFALNPQGPGRPRRGFGFMLDEIFVADDLGPDEAALKIGVNDSGGLRSAAVAFNGLGAHFFFAGREIACQAQGAVAGVNDLVQAVFRGSI